MYIFMFSFYSSSSLDENFINDGDGNIRIVNVLRKDLDTMLPNFEEYLRKKYPSYVSIEFKMSLNSIDFYLEQIRMYKVSIIIKSIWHIHRLLIGLMNQFFL